MYNIHFYTKSRSLRHRILSGETLAMTSGQIFSELESYRDSEPHVFNIETTNNCNMNCLMCPRTTLMTRKIGTIQDEDFERCLDQITPFQPRDLEEFWRFVKKDCGIDASDRHENAFYFYRLPQCLILHGYGEPLLDPGIAKRVQACSRRNIPTYFSCVPANITLEKMILLMEAGLDVIKFSIDSLTDEGQKTFRGERNNFTRSFDTIREILEYKRLHAELKTEIVITMLALSRETADQRQQEKFMSLWERYPVYAYVKSQDNRWYYKENDNFESQSHYERQYCEFAWTSLSIMANGTVVPCTQDYNAEMDMGNIREQSLKNIWNSKEYRKFRQSHIDGSFPNGHKCKDRCDLPKLYQRLKGCVPGRS